MSPEERCAYCGCPMVDHGALRYPLKAWILHLPERFKAWLSR